MHLLRFVIVPLLLVNFWACGSLPKTPELIHYDPERGYRFDNLELGDGNTDSLFVILAFSGGGTRAASLSYGVLETLRDTKIKWKGQQKRLLDEVDIISSVSGGSFTASYYALHRKNLFDGTFEQEFLKKDIEQALFAESLLPSSWFELAGFDYGRSDLAADFYNQNLFDGATFQRLIDQRTRPFLMLNATDMTTGSQFPFIQDQFDLICADLAGLTVARAVASSSAFPGLLTPLSFQNYAGQCHYEEPRWIRFAVNDRQIAPERAIRAEQRRSYYQHPEWQKRRDFIHLMDGGISDNIGLRSIIWSLESSDPAFSIQRRVTQGIIKKLVIIVVDAATDTQSNRDNTAETPGVVDVITAAAIIPLDNYSFDTVDRAKSALGGYTEDTKVRQRCQNILQEHCPGTKLPGGDLSSVDVYLSHVTFHTIDDPELRFQYKNLPTNFALPADTVDELRAMGGQLLKSNPAFIELLDKLH